MRNNPAFEIEKSPSPLEFTPARRPRQRRSHAAYERMIEVAGRLLEERDFDSVSIRDLAIAASCSIGSFYYRFQTKEHFFQVLIQDMIDRREQEARETFQSLPLAELPPALARGALTNFQTHKGLLRSVIKKHLEGMRSWEPIARMGRRIATEFQRRVADERGMNLTPSEAERIDFAFIGLYGLLARSLLDLDTIFGLETPFIEEQAVDVFTEAIARALQRD
jgi:AcrR family transcriptional regulator